MGLDFNLTLPHAKEGDKSRAENQTSSDEHEYHVGL